MGKLTKIQIGIAIKLLALIILLVFVYPRWKPEPIHSETKKEIINDPSPITTELLPTPTMEIPKKIIPLPEKRKDETKKIIQNNPVSLIKKSEEKKSQDTETKLQIINSPEIKNNDQKSKTQSPITSSEKKSQKNFSENPTLKKNFPAIKLAPTQEEIEAMFSEQSKTFQKSPFTREKIIPSAKDIEHLYEEVNSDVKK